MIVPIDERMINRCHGIFDSMLIKKFRFHRVSIFYTKYLNKKIIILLVKIAFREIRIVCFKSGY